MNRIHHGYEKYNGNENCHYNDAICIGNVPETFKDYTTVSYIIEAKGRGNRLKGQPNACGILEKNGIHREKTYTNEKIKEHYQTGDICKITMPKGKYKGTYIARISIRHSGSFDFRSNGHRITTSYKNCKIIQKNDGYDYKCVHIN